MLLLTPTQSATLSSWNFLHDYATHRKDLVDVARIVYKTIEKTLGRAPTQAQCEGALKASLLGTNPFSGILASKHHASPVLHGPFAEAMARYLLDKDWDDIIKP